VGHAVQDAQLDALAVVLNVPAAQALHCLSAVLVPGAETYSPGWHEDHIAHCPPEAKLPEEHASHAPAPRQGIAAGHAACSCQNPSWSHSYGTSFRHSRWPGVQSALHTPSPLQRPGQSETAAHVPSLVQERVWVLGFPATHSVVPIRHSQPSLATPLQLSSLPGSQVSAAAGAMLHSLHASAWHT
jgi:hypothetical protein